MDFEFYPGNSKIGTKCRHRVSKNTGQNNPVIVSTVSTLVYLVLTKYFVVKPIYFCKTLYIHAGLTVISLYYMQRESCKTSIHMQSTRVVKNKTQNMMCVCVCVCVHIYSMDPKVGHISYRMWYKL
jgi:hypothetical protein